MEWTGSSVCMMVVWHCSQGWCCFSSAHRGPGENSSELSKGKATCHGEDGSWERKAERTLFSAFVLGLDGSQSRSFRHLSEWNSRERYLVQEFSAVMDKLPVFISHWGTEHPVLEPVGSWPKPDPREWHCSVDFAGRMCSWCSSSTAKDQTAKKRMMGWLVLLSMVPNLGHLKQYGSQNQWIPV